MSFYFKIAPKAPLFKSLTYKSEKDLDMGQRVKVPLGQRKVAGLVLKKLLSPPSGERPIKEILEVDEGSPPLGLPRVQWLKWMSHYYHYSLGMIFDMCFLPLRKNTKIDSPQKAGPVLNKRKAFIKLRPEQSLCLRQIEKSQGFKVHLIHGVTGSGKTEIYKELIYSTLNRGQQALVLLPEIFLTPQIVGRLSESFDRQIALLHSQISARQKKTEWQALLLAKKNLLVGTRSALFCPLPRLGLIIIDEEHDSSFKQEEKFRYHARDSASVLAKKLGIPLVLGSATPDFSSYQQALSGKYQLHELKKRALTQNLPSVTVADLKQSRAGDRPFWLSDILFEKMSQTLQRGKQVALFLNRRGQARALICPQCGHTQKCLNCDITLTLHQEIYLLCHYCSYVEQKPSHCPSCKNSHWLERGIGTQKAQKELERLFPQFKIFRVDRDSIQSKEDMENFIEVMEKEKAQIILGTQMLSKGLNFPSIYLVGLILADMDFHFPDFRAEERTFQTLLQMAGRAGRMSKGEVVLQTFNPKHPSIFFAKNHDYKSFFYEGIQSRKKWLYPPFSRLCLLKIDSSKEQAGRELSEEIAKKAKKLVSKGIVILGPTPAPLSKIKNRYRFQILIKGQSHNLLSDFLKNLWPQIKKKSFAQVKVDRDPLSML